MKQFHNTSRYLQIMMSLEKVVSEKTIKSRHSLLSNYLKHNGIGELSEPEKVYFKHVFERFYTPDEEYTKFHISRITNISIINDKYGNKCFSICVDNTWYPTSIKRLSGSNRNEKANIIRALRNAIEEQIHDYRRLNTLNPNSICPVTHKALGEDAQVDHFIPFHILADQWLKQTTHVSYVYNLDKMNYILQEPHLTNWAEYHLEKAILRWISKEGNAFAHKLYVA